MPVVKTKIKSSLVKKLSSNCEYNFDSKPLPLLVYRGLVFLKNHEMGGDSEFSCKNGGGGNPYRGLSIEEAGVNTTLY